MSSRRRILTMTAFTGNDAAAATGSAEAQELIDRAQSEDVLLTVLSAWELCALGGPRQVLFDEVPARAWAGMRRGARKKLPAVIFGGLEERGLLIRHAPAVPLAARRGQPEPRPEEYAFSPKLGLAMAARARPSLAVVWTRASYSRCRPWRYAATTVRPPGLAAPALLAVRSTTRPG